MNEILIDSKLKSDVDQRLRNIFGENTHLRSELQDGGAFVLFVAELDLEMAVSSIFDLYDEAESMLNASLPFRQTEPRWMLSFHVRGRTLYANIGGLESPSV